jgi:hypothetical protein
VLLSIAKKHEALKIPSLKTHMNREFVKELDLAFNPAAQVRRIMGRPPSVVASSGRDVCCFKKRVGTSYTNTDAVLQQFASPPAFGVPSSPG